MIAPSTSNTNQIPRAASAPVSGDVPTFFEAGAKSPESSSPGGKHSPKAVAFWQRKAALRKEAHRCSRCAKTNANGFRQCDRCREYAAELRASKRSKPVAVDSGALAAIERRVGNLEHYFAKLSEMQRAAYRQGYCAGRRLHRKSVERASYHDAMPRASGQDLREMSHAYDR